MMKKIFSILAIAAAATAASCSQVEENFSTVKDGEEVTVSFTAALPEIATRAYSDGKTAKNLVWAVYPSGEETPEKTVLFSDDTKTFDDNLTVTVTTALAVGKTYDILFWAADASNNAYDLNLATQKMTVTYANLTANNDGNDAFFAFKGGLKVTGQINETITLTRPFAQVNLGTDDYATAKKRNLLVGKTGMSANLPNVLNLADGTVSGNSLVTIPAGAIPAVTIGDDDAVTCAEKFPVDNYWYLEMNYVLTGAAKTLIDCVCYVYEEGSENPLEPAITVPNVPVQRNYRTNIYGSLLTDPANFKTTINPAYTDENGNANPDWNVKVVEVLTVDDVPEAIEQGAEYVKVQEAPAADAEIKLPAVDSDKSDKEVAIALPETENKIMFSYEKEQPEEGKANFANVKISAGTADNVVINLPDSHVTLNGKVVEATVSTSQTTLVVESGAEIEKLIVAAGNVTIMKGGKVGSVVKAEGNEQETVLRVYEEDMPAKVDDNIKVILLGKIVIGETSYDTISDAIAAAVDGDVIVLAKGIYSADGLSTKGKVLTLKGRSKDVLFKIKGTAGTLGSKITLENITIETAEGNYNGLNTGAPIIFNDCAFKNIYFGYTDLEFNNCTFDSNGQEHCVWTYGSENVTFNNCEFQYNDRCVNVYFDNGNYVSIPERVVNFSGCIFQTNNENSLGAVEINSAPFTNGVNVIFEECTEPAYGEMVFISQWDSGKGKNALVTVDGEVVHCPPVELNGVYYSSIEAALTAAEDGTALNLKLAAGTYIIPDKAQNKTLAFVGASDNPADVIIEAQDEHAEHYDYALDGSTVTFENLSIVTPSGIANYPGYVRCSGTYKNCIINNTYTLFGNSTFEGCTFNVSGNQYNLWTWGTEKATFSECTFNCDGKAVLVYGGNSQCTYTFNDCTFNDNGDGTVSGKAAIEVGSHNNAKYDININRCTATGFDINSEGDDTGTTLWGNKNSMTSDMLNVVIDGKDIY